MVTEPAGRKQTSLHPELIQEINGHHTDMKKWAQCALWQIPFRQQKILFSPMRMVKYCNRDQKGAWISLLGDFHIFTCQGHEQHGLVGLIESGGLDQSSPEIPSNLHCFVIV